MGYLKEFKSCPICHSKETTTKQAYETVKEDDDTPIDKRSAISAEKVPIPLISPQYCKSTQVPILVHHLDYCANCGFKYCTKVEIVERPNPANPQIIKPVNKIFRG